MKCTKCQKGQMREYDLMGEYLDRCDHCYSIFLDEDEMYIIKGLSKSDIAHCTKTEYNEQEINIEEIEKVYKFKTGVICPKCQIEMAEYNYAYDSPVLINRCKKCSGVFLDAHDLYVIRDFLDGKFRDEKKIAAAKLKLALEYEKRREQEKKDFNLSTYFGGQKPEVVKVKALETKEEESILSKYFN